MPAERVSMRRVREILRLKHACGATDRAIARSLGVARSTVALTLERAAAAGPDLAAAGDADRPRARGDAVSPAPERRPGCRRKSEPDWAHVHRELRRPGVTLMLLWEEYRAAEPGGYRLQPLVRALPRVGEPAVADDAPGASRGRAPVCRLRRPDRPGRSTSGPARSRRRRSSSPCWVPPTTPTPRRPRPRPCRTGSARMDARSPSWAACRASSSPTTRRSASTRANWYEPGLNRTYLDLAAHYGTAILPTRTRKPRDKAKVEVGRARGRALDPGAPAQPTLLLAGRAQRGDRRAGRRPQCAADEASRGQPRRAVRRARSPGAQAACRPSPTTTPSGACGGSALDYHVDIDGHYYSVPYRLISEQVEARLTARTIELFHKGERVAVHLRGGRPRPTHDRARAHAERPSALCRVDVRAHPARGGRHRPDHRQARRLDPGEPAAPRAGLPRLPRHPAAGAPVRAPIASKRRAIAGSTSAPAPTARSTRSCRHGLDRHALGPALGPGRAAARPPQHPRLPLLPMRRSRPVLTHPTLDQLQAAWPARHGPRVCRARRRSRTWPT